MKFTSLGLHEHLVKAIVQLAYQEPTAIQQAAIPAILNGQDIMAQAQTGTGKTAAFALPILHQLLAIPNANSSARALVLVPTRELAQQVGNSFNQYGEYTQLNTVILYGGSSLNTQLTALNRGADIIVATPGRLLDHLRRGSLSLTQLECLVLDEADRMLDMGFIDDIRKIRATLPQNCQTLLFSATFVDAVYDLGKSLLNNPTFIEIGERNAAATQVEQIAYEVDKKKKSEITSFLIGSKNWHQVLIFTRTKITADLLAKELTQSGIKAEAIHGDKSQGARDRALINFKQNGIRALVATDVASRGLDIQQLKYVINYELPYNAEDYIHRIGRSGRAGESGLAITLLSHDEVWMLDQIHEVSGTRLLQQWLPGYEPDLTQNFNASRKPTRKANNKKRRRH